MKISTPFALFLLASLASAQSKGPAPVKDPNQGGYFPPPPGMSFLVAGGSDNCANAATADAITGLGTFAVTTVGATNGVPDATCNANIDVWFYWTSTVTGSVIINACGGATADTILAVWNDGAAPGTCPTTAIVCNDDSCALQSQVTFAAVSGTSYFIQWGAFGATTTYSGTFNIGTPPPPPTNDDCSTPIVLPAGPQVVAFNTTLATTGTQGQTEAACLDYTTTNMQKDIWYTWTPTKGGPVTVSTCGLMTGPTTNADTRIGIYDGAGCPVTAAIACNDDSGHSPSNPVYTCTGTNFNSTVDFTAVCGNTYTIQIAGYGATNNVGSFSIVENGTPCGPVSTPYCFGDGTGTACPCGNNGAAGNGCANSLNANGGNLTSTGNPSMSADTFVLQGSGMPNSSVLYFQGTTQISVAFGDGLRCAGGSVIRLGTKNNVGGASAYPVGADTVISIRGLNVAGNVRTYQAWYRNAAAFCTVSTFNLTNGLQATWTP